MGLIYDVFYRRSKDFDREVGAAYLDRIAENAKKDKSLIGARAVCKNGEPHTLTLRDGPEGPEWV